MNKKIGFPGRVMTMAAIALVVIPLLLFIWYVRHELLLIFAGLLLALLVGTPAGWLSSRTALPKQVALFLVIVGIGMVVFLAGWWIVPRFITQLGELSQVIPRGVEQLKQYLMQHGWGKEILDRVSPVSDVSLTAEKMMSRLFGIFSGVFGVMAGLFIFLFSGLFLAIHPGIYINAVLKLFPVERRKGIRELMHETGAALTWWLIGQLFAMIILGVMVGVGLWMRGVPLALSLGILCGLFSFIPIIGSILALLPAALIAITQGAAVFLYVLLLYFGAQIIETYLLTPLIQQRTVRMPPVIGLVSQVLMGALAGPLGVALAFPLTVAGMVLVKKLHVERIR